MVAEVTTTARKARPAAAAAPADPEFLPTKKRVGRPRTAALLADFPKHRIARVDTLVGYVNNPRTHSKAQLDRLVASIKAFGFTNPILIDGNRGVIAGHGRLLAAQKLKMELVPVIELAHLTKAQKRAYIVADNKLALDADWDEELLTLELGELRDEGFDLALTGFNGRELDALFGEGGEGLSDKEATKAEVTCPGCGHVFVP